MNKDWVWGSDVMRLAMQASVAYRGEVQRLGKADEKSQAEVKELTLRLTQAWEQLTVTLMPGLVADHLDWCANLLHLPAIAASAVQRRIAGERRVLREEGVEIDENPDYVSREAGLNECSIRLAELLRLVEPLRGSIASKEMTPFFRELIDFKYDSPDYWFDFWELTYYRHWKHGDLIVEKFGEPYGLKRFREVRERYEEEVQARDTLEAEIAEWEAKKAGIQALIDRRAAIVEALASLEDREWAQSRARIFAHVRDLGDKDLVGLLTSYDPALYIAKRVTGLRAKIRYLDEIRAKWVLAPLAQAERKLRKAERGTVKFRRPKHRRRSFKRDEMVRKYSVPTEKWEKRWSRFDAVFPRLVEYDDYDAYDGSVIWWHQMTGGSVKARFIPEVQDFYAERRAAKLAAREENAHEQAIAALADEASVDADTSMDWDDMS